MFKKLSFKSNTVKACSSGLIVCITLLGLSVSSNWRGRALAGDGSTSNTPSGKSKSTEASQESKKKLALANSNENRPSISNVSKENGPEDAMADTQIVEKSQTNINFSESLIEGKMRAPSGFFIRGRKGQDLTKMIKLRRSFRSEILKSTGFPNLSSGDN